MQFSTCGTCCLKQRGVGSLRDRGRVQGKGLNYTIHAEKPKEWCVFFCSPSQDFCPFLPPFAGWLGHAERMGAHVFFFLSTISAHTHSLSHLFLFLSFPLSGAEPRSRRSIRTIAPRLLPRAVVTCSRRSAAAESCAKWKRQSARHPPVLLLAAPVLTGKPP